MHIRNHRSTCTCCVFKIIVKQIGEPTLLLWFIQIENKIDLIDFGMRLPVDSSNVHTELHLV